MTLLVDTSIVMYAGGGPHRHRAPCRAVLRQIAEGQLPAVASAEVVQEILHRFSRGDREIGARMARSVLDLFGELLPVDTPVVQQTLARFRAHEGLSARDAVHAATVFVHGLEGIVSIDTDFDRVEGLRRVDPIELAPGRGG